MQSNLQSHYAEALKASDEQPSLQDRLEQLRDEIRLQVELAGMEAREKWHALEAQLEPALHAASQTTHAAAKLVDDTKENAKGALEDLQTRFELFKESLKDATGERHT